MVAQSVLQHVFHFVHVCVCCSILLRARVRFVAVVQLHLLVGFCLVDLVEANWLLI